MIGVIMAGGGGLAALAAIKPIHDCNLCNDAGWVCENRPSTPWGGGENVIAKTDGCYFDEQRYGWVRFGNFFPFEVFGNGPFFHDKINEQKTIDLAPKHSR